MKILLFAFKKFGPYKRNKSQEVLRTLSKVPSVHKKVFDVEFSRRMFEKVFEKIDPDIIIGLGQHPRAKKLRIERTAHNQMKRSPRHRAQRIDTHDSRVRRMSLTLPKIASTTVTYNAGTYVCNFSMWVTEGWCRKRARRCAFIHIPQDADTRNVQAYLRGLITHFKRFRN